MYMHTLYGRTGAEADWDKERKTRLIEPKMKMLYVENVG